MWAGTGAILNQRPICDHSMFWDLHLLAGGTLEMETDDGSPTGYTVLTTAGTVNDGNSHQVSVQRVGGMLTISIDGTSTTGPVASNANFGALVALRQGLAVCAGESAGVVSIASVCVGSP
jgi:hypothetical protein